MYSTRLVIRQNIERYLALFKITSDAAELQRIEKLLLEEEAKLNEFHKGES